MTRISGRFRNTRPNRRPRARSKTAGAPGGRRYRHPNPDVRVGPGPEPGGESSPVGPGPREASQSFARGKKVAKPRQPPQRPGKVEDDPGRRYRALMADRHAGKDRGANLSALAAEAAERT